MKKPFILLKMLVSFMVGMCIGYSLSPYAMAADYYCEVMTVKGEAFVTQDNSMRKTLKEGDILKAGDFLEVEKGGQVDLAFDKEWNNITRIWESSQVKIRSIYPTGLMLDRGDIFSKLNKLPKGTTFEIQTPTAVAAVRGTEFLTSVAEQGQTSVVSYEHNVDVFNLDADGNLGNHVVVGETEKTVVPRINEPPVPPVKAPESDMQKVSQFSSEIGEKVKEVLQEGRFAQVQSSGSVEAMMKFAEISKQTEGEKKENPQPDDNRKPVDGGGPGGPPSGGTSDLNPEQMQQMKDRFVELGGNPQDFDHLNKDIGSMGITPKNLENFSFPSVAPEKMKEPVTPMREPVIPAAFPGSGEPPIPQTAFDPSRLPFREPNLPINPITITGAPTNNPPPCAPNCPGSDGMPGSGGCGPPPKPPCHY